MAPPGFLFFHSFFFYHDMRCVARKMMLATTCARKVGKPCNGWRELCWKSRRRRAAIAFAGAWPWKAKQKKNRGESWRELFYRTTAAAAAARWWWGATLFLCLSGKAIHAGGKPGCTHCSWLFQVQIRDDDQNSMSKGFSLCLLFFWTEQKNCLRRKSRQGSAGHNKR